MITEAYTNLKNTMKYYGNETNVGAHLPFNFELINNLNDQSNATSFNNAVNSWLGNMPKGKTANWVVIIIIIKESVESRLVINRIVHYVLDRKP